MKRLTLLPFVALMMTGACADNVSAPPSLDRPSLAGTEPPPKISATGSAFLSSSLAAGGGIYGFASTKIVLQDECVPSPFLFFQLEGDYFRNNPATNAWASLTPVDGTGTGKIHETQKGQDASGKWTVFDDDVEHDIKLLTYDGSSLFLFPDDGGTADGVLTAEVTACGQKIHYTGNIDFVWGDFIDD